MYTIRKKFHFSAAHRLEKLPEGHPCSTIHGHNYTVIVELSSVKLNDVGFVVDYRELDYVKKYIETYLDHRFLNEKLAFNPTAENIARFIFYAIKPKYPQLTAVEVSETDKTSARYTPNYDEQ